MYVVKKNPFFIYITFNLNIVSIQTIVLTDPGMVRS